MGQVKGKRQKSKSIKFSHMVAPSCPLAIAKKRKSGIIVAFHAGLASTRESALEELERLKLDKRMWEAGSNHSYYTARSLLENSKYCRDFENFVLKFRVYKRNRDRRSLIRHVLSFFRQYPVMQGLSGWLPLMTRPLSFEPLFCYCRNCASIIPRRCMEKGEIHCCEQPDLHPYFEIRIHLMPHFGVTNYSMRFYGDLIREGINREIKRLKIYPGGQKPTLPRLRSGEKAGTVSGDLQHRRQLHEIATRGPYYKDEILKGRKDPAYQSEVIRRVHSTGLPLHYSLEVLTDLLLQQDLNDYREVCGRKVPAVSTLKRWYRKPNPK